MQSRILAGIILLLSAACHDVANAQIVEPKMLTREQWKARPVNKKYVETHGVAYKGIVVHHTEISQQLPKWRIKTTAQKMYDIQEIHQGNKQRFRPRLKGLPWADFAYHYFIDVDGQIAQGREPQYQGDSGTNYDMSGLLLVVLQGSFIKERPTTAQLRSLDNLAIWLAAKHGLRAEQISAHDDQAPGQTDCPGPNLKSYLDELRQKTAAALKKR